jgi:hypothetical protein
MEQKDYLMREIEKIGVVLRSILGGLINKKEYLSIEIQAPFAQTKELLINEINFDIGKFVTFDEKAAREYLSGFNGMNPANLELLAEILFQYGISGQSDSQNNFLEKALQIYALCNDTDKTYSGPRENNIKKIKNMYNNFKPKI